MFRVKIYILIVMEMVLTLVTGMFVGIANIIPGVSGGTIAVVFNIYDKLLNAITFNIKKLIKNWKFVVPVFLGMAIGILVFSKGIQFLYSKFPVQTNFAFTGLIIGSIPLIKSLMTENIGSWNDDNGNFSRKKALKHIFGIAAGIFVGMLLIIVLSVLERKYGSKEGLAFIMPAWTFGLGAKVLFGGFLGAVGMIIPGVSGSLLMLILGVYPIIITAIPAFFVHETMMTAFLYLMPFGIGVLAGLLIGAKVISILIKKFPTYTYAVILGLIMASAGTLFPGFADIKTVGCGIGCTVCFIAGICLAYFSSKVTDKKEETGKVSEN